MEFSKLQEKISYLKENGVTVSEVPCKDPHLLQSLERMFGIELPEPVRQFYSHYEYLQIGPFEFTWARNLPELVPKLRREFHIPKNYLPILWDGMGGYYHAVCAEAGALRPENYGSVVQRPAVSGKTVEFDCGEFLEFVLSRAEIAGDDV